METEEQQSLSQGDFLKLGGISGAGLILGHPLLVSAKSVTPIKPKKSAPDSNKVGAFPCDA